MASNRPPTREYQRAYKACIQCRKKKARCYTCGNDPCLRCLRSRSKCVFADEPRGGRTRLKQTDTANSELSSTARRNTDVTGGPNQGNEPFEGRLNPSSEVDGGAPFEAPGNDLYREDSGNSVMRAVVSSSNDALDVLFDVAAHHRENNFRYGNDRATSSAYPVPTDRSEQHNPSAPAAQGIDLPSPYQRSTLSNLPVYPPELLRVWGSCFFVKVGWLTAGEAINYVDLFFKNLSPLSPVLTGYYSCYENHAQLIRQEPMLCGTILMISSRYHTLLGAGGTSKSYFLHNRLWKHCEHLVQRVMFGQEKGANPKARAIGTIESLLLICEWHPRSLHFPPESHGWDADLITHEDGPDAPTERGLPGDNAESVQWMEDVIEPSRRSDRMSWMLMGAALSLAHELRIFDLPKPSISQNMQTVDLAASRRLRLQKLLYVFHTQLAARLGYMSLLSSNITNTVSKPWRPMESEGGRQNQWEMFMNGWIQLTWLLKSIADVFFQSPASTKDCLLSGRYVGLLDHFRPLLSRWQEEYFQSRDLENHALRRALLIEYQSVRVLLNSVGMQAIVERTLNSDLQQRKGRSLPSNDLDQECIHEVVDGCLQVLRTVNEYAQEGSLRFLPAKPIYGIVTSSVLLLKALSIGVRHDQFQISLDTLDSSILALRSNSLDDLHCVPRYAILLEILVAKLREHYMNSSRTRRRAEGMAINQFSTVSQQESLIPNAVGGGFDATRSSLDMDLSFADVSTDDWLRFPFDPSMAPFDLTGEHTHVGYGLEPTTLDFMWNLSMPQSYDR